MECEHWWYGNLSGVLFGAWFMMTCPPTGAEWYDLLAAVFVKGMGFFMITCGVYDWGYTVAVRRQIRH